MKKILILLLLFGFLIAPSIKADTVLYCQSKLATGLDYENGSWKTMNFKPQRLTVKFNYDYSRLEGLPQNPKMDCKIPYSLIGTDNLIYCVDTKYNDSTFKYNKKTKRFVYYFNPFGGYVGESDDTDSLFAGTCKAF